MANADDVVFCRGTGQSDDSDIWDDTALIKAYDKALASFKRALKGENTETPEKRENPGKKRKNNKKSKGRKRNTLPDKEWQVGDSCYAYWSEDGNLYAATISSIDQEKGTCVVIYSDYGNEEEQMISDLLTEESVLDEDALKSTDTQEVESSTEESDRSFTPLHSSSQKPKSKGRSPKGPPSWVPGFPPGFPSGFPPGPPPGPYFHKADGRRSESPGPLPPGWPPLFPPGLPMIPPPPPPMNHDIMDDDEALGSMLISWYMSGYHTGYYLGLKQARREAAISKKSHRK